MVGKAFCTHLNKTELVIRLPGLIDYNESDPTSAPINISTCKGLLYSGLKTCFAIRMQQRIMQTTHVEKIGQSSRGCLTQSVGISNGCGEKCTVCENYNLLKQFTDLVKQANEITRPEPFAQIVSRRLEKCLMAFRTCPWLLLSSRDFPNCMYRALLEILKVGLRSHLTERSNFGFGALTRMVEVYRMATSGQALDIENGKLELKLTQDSCVKFKSIYFQFNFEPIEIKSLH